eukprot:GHVH01000023.1.p2 GENE.GHVH01000023.1~~GHVH01000023.1.p2  ORF type:complete len:160 (+),score=33.62 GHVH01000023.1:95-574(+)
MALTDDILKRTLFVGSLPDDVNQELLYNTFVPFGDIRTVQIPVNKITNKHRGFGFVEFLEESDALDAIDNMHDNEFKGRVLVVKLSRAPRGKREDREVSRPVWAEDFMYRSKETELTNPDDEDAYDEALMAFGMEAKTNMATAEKEQREKLDTKSKDGR